jgi:NitT/TauT family transport system substrate-binding protein
MRRSQTLTLLTAAVAATGLPCRVRAQSVPLRIAYIPTENCAQALYAQELGLFAKAGLDVQLQPINFSASIASAVLSNAVDIGNSSTLTMTLAHHKDIPIVYVAPGNLFVLRKESPESGIVVAESSAIRKASDLNGKTFGCSGLGSFGEFIPRNWVDTNGGDSSTMKFVEAPNAELGTAVRTGRCDAAFISPPAFHTSLEQGCRILAIGSDSVARRFMGSGWFATTGWAKANAATVTAFAGAIHDATRWAVANPDKTIDILVKYLKLDPAVVRASPRVIFGDALAHADIQPAINVVAKYSHFPAFSADELIYVPSHS